MDDDKKFKSPDLKTILAGSGVAIALYTIAPFKEFFFTREEGAGIQRQVQENKSEINSLKKQISDFSGDVTHKFNALEEKLEGKIEAGQKDIKSDFKGELDRAVQAINDQNRFNYDRVVERIERDYQSLSNRIDRNEVKNK